MKNKDLYKEVFSQVHTSVQINVEDYQIMKKQHFPVRTFVALAAIVALMAAMTATAVALNLFGLRDLAFPDRTAIQIPHVDASTGDISYEDRVVDMISLQGYADTPENQACAEWNDFYWDYVSDKHFSNDPTGLDPKYDVYSVYDQTMAEKLDEIVDKYGLKLHRAIEDVPDREAWLERFGPTFLSDMNIGFFGYAYDDGTCAFDGDADLGPDYSAVSYQFRYSRKGYLDTVSLNVGNLADYQDWDYQTKDGVPVKLSLGPHRSFIWADLEEGFLFINVLNGTEGDETFAAVPIDQKGLESLADQFDFSVLS